jgi:hypothetical protein
LYRKGDYYIVALHVFSHEVFAGPLPSNALAIHIAVSTMYENGRVKIKSNKKLIL